MPVTYKDENCSNNESVTVNGTPYTPDYVIGFPIDKDKIDIKGCTCVFSIRDIDNGFFRKYIGAGYFEKLDSDNVGNVINGYLPENIYCFTDTDFPLVDFIEEQNFKVFGE